MNLWMLVNESHVYDGYCRLLFVLFTTPAITNHTAAGHTCIISIRQKMFPLCISINYDTVDITSKTFQSPSLQPSPWSEKCHTYSHSYNSAIHISSANIHIHRKNFLMVISRGRVKHSIHLHIVAHQHYKPKMFISSVKSYFLYLPYPSLDLKPYCFPSSYKIFTFD